MSLRGWLLSRQEGNQGTRGRGRVGRQQGRWETAGSADSEGPWIVLEKHAIISRCEADLSLPGVPVG